MTVTQKIFYAIIPVVFYGIITYAQIEPPVPVNPAVTKSKSDKKHTINFDDELVEGTAQKPEFLYLFQKKNFNYKRLIKLRENFIPEMRRSAEEIQRLKGGR